MQLLQAGILGVEAFDKLLINKILRGFMTPRTWLGGAPFLNLLNIGTNMSALTGTI